MRVLVTGHLGYIGTIMTPLLLKQGHEVVGLDSDLYSRCTFGAGIANVPHIHKDVRHVQVSDLKGFEAVIHLAALSNDPLGNLNPQLTYDINHVASVRLAEMAKKAGVKRFVFSSSCSNYGAAGDDFLDESSAFNPVTPHAEAFQAVIWHLLVSHPAIKAAQTKCASDLVSAFRARPGAGAPAGTGTPPGSAG